MNKVEQRIADELAQVAQIKKWADRLRKLKSRKDNPLSEAQFCKKYGFEITHFNRRKNLHVSCQKDTFKSVEEALRQEGV